MDNKLFNFKTHILSIVFFSITTSNLFGQIEILEKDKSMSCFHGYYNHGQLDLNIYKDSTYKLYLLNSYSFSTPYFYNIFDSGKVVIAKNKIVFQSSFANKPIDISNKVNIGQYFCCFSTYKVVPDSIEITLRNFTHYDIKNVTITQKGKEIYTTKLLHKDEVIKIYTLNSSTSSRDTIKVSLNNTNYFFPSDKEMRLTLQEKIDAWIDQPIFKSAKILKNYLIKIQESQADKTAKKATLTNFDFKRVIPIMCP